MRSNRICGIYIVLFIIIFYFGYEASTHEDISSIEFFNKYFNNFQKTLFTGTILFAPVVFFSHIDYLQPEMFVRIKGRLFQYVWSKYSLISIVTAFFFLLSYVIVSTYFNFAEPLSILKFVFILRVFLFIMTCFVINEIVYLFSRNLFFGVSAVVALNFALLLTLSYFNVYSEFVITDAVHLYTICVTVFGLLFLFMTTNKKEILK